MKGVKGMKATIDTNKVNIALHQSKENVTFISVERSKLLEKSVRNAEYLAMIDRGIAQLSEGKGQEHELVE